jgi:hypothetical protein
MEGTDHNEMGGGTPSVQQQSAKCKFERNESRLLSRTMSMRRHARRFVYEFYGVASETRNMNNAAFGTGKACALRVLTFLESVCCTCQ